MSEGPVGSQLDRIEQGLEILNKGLQEQAKGAIALSEAIEQGQTLAHKKTAEFEEWRDKRVAQDDAWQERIEHMTEIVMHRLEQHREGERAAVILFQERIQAIEHAQQVLCERLDGLAKQQKEMFQNIHDRIELYSGFPEALKLLQTRLAAVEKNGNYILNFLMKERKELLWKCGEW